VQTVIARIFYSINKSGNERLTLGELRKSNFMDVLSLLDEEDDINKVSAPSISFCSCLYDVRMSHMGEKLPLLPPLCLPRRYTTISLMSTFTCSMSSFGNWTLTTIFCLIAMIFYPMCVAHSTRIVFVSLLGAKFSVWLRIVPGRLHSYYSSYRSYHDASSSAVSQQCRRQNGI
jgi:hypothetical protein